jgi:asparagine synthase (glutamine-hydrolysing)
MCGIAGILGTGSGTAERQAVVARMIDAIRHRGPDARSDWTSNDGIMTLGHARLSIQDLSERGAQPMGSASGRYVISYNGEVYNFRELMQELRSRGHTFRGHSDTEVILASIDEWGLESALNRFVGMFAFAVWDEELRTLYLVRDRLGIKPLYYRNTGSVLTFGSELKAIRASSKEMPSIDRAALALYLRHSCLPAPHTIYEGVRKLEPGSILTATIGDDGLIRSETRRWWSLEQVVTAPDAAFDGSYTDAVEQLHDLLEEAVSQRMVADVPLGAFLSGGMDSSAVASLMQNDSRPTSTFTIGFAEGSHNEAEWAKRVANHLHTDHHELYVSPDDALAVIPELSAIYDEPFADSSQIPTILVSRLARRDVTVTLSGDGGDELFSGYKRYEATQATWKSIGWMPRPLRSALAAVLAPLSGPLSKLADPVFGKIYDRYGVKGNRGNELQRAAAVLRRSSREDLYRYMMSHWKAGAGLVQGTDDEAKSLLADPPAWLTSGQFGDYMMRADACTYLPNDILTKLDRASMSCSLEARVPLLDHRVVELVDRPKMGFSVPIDDWLRGPLRGWAEDLLSEQRIGRDGFLVAAPIVERWREHQSGSRNWGGHLWDVLMFQSWLDEQRR